MVALFENIQFQTIDLCNRRCDFCPASLGLRQTREVMAEQTLGLILDQLQELGFEGRISPYMMNEALLDRRLPHWISMIRRRFPRNILSLSTNGDLLQDEELRAALAHCGLDAIAVNCYGPEQLYAQRSDLIQRWAASEQDLVVRQDPGGYRSLKARNGQVNVWVSWVPQSLAHFWNRGGALAQVEPRRTSWRYPFCNLPFERMCINQLGQAVLCCGDWRYEVIMGDLRRTSLGQIWFGLQYEYYRRMHQQQELDGLPLCSTCNRMRHVGDPARLSADPAC
jgi:hypothetical protein